MKPPEREPFTSPLERIRELEEELEEHRRSTSLSWALDQAAAAMADAMTEEECYRTIATQLDSLGLNTSVLRYDRERECLHLVHMADPSGAIAKVEAVTGLARSMELPAKATDFHRLILEHRSTEFSSDGVELTKAMLPKVAKSFARVIAQALCVDTTIGAPLVIEDQVVGILSVSSAELTRGDTTSISAFAHQVSAILTKVQLVGKLRRSLDDLEKAEAQLVESQKMQAVGRLAGGIAHDLNNLLTSVSVSCEVLRADTSADAPAAVELESIAYATSGAAALIRQLLAFGRKQVLDRKPQNLNDIITGMGRLLERLLGEDVEVKLLLTDDLGSARVDKTQLEQVMLNLAVNARDAMERGGQLRIETHNVDAADMNLEDETLSGKLICLRFNDNGCGMDAETQAQIFEPFFTTKPAGRGTGLGLSVVYGIVRQHGGLVRIESKPNQGALFELFFPATDAAPETARPRSQPANLQFLPRAGQRILLVEDDDGVRRAVQRVLRRKGYDVASAGCVFDALQLFEAEGDTFQLLLSDVVLPDGLGPNLAEELTKRRPELGVVLATGYAGARAHSDLARAQEWTLLHKPFELELLLDAVAAAIGQPA